MINCPPTGIVWALYETEALDCTFGLFCSSVDSSAFLRTVTNCHCREFRYETNASLLGLDLRKVGWRGEERGALKYDDISQTRGRI